MSMTGRRMRSIIMDEIASVEPQESPLSEALENSDPAGGWYGVSRIPSEGETASTSVEEFRPFTSGINSLIGESPEPQVGPEETVERLGVAQTATEAAMLREVELRTSTLGGVSATTVPASGTALTEVSLQQAYNSVMETQIYGTHPFGAVRGTRDVDEKPFSIQSSINESVIKELRKKWKKVFKLEKGFEDADLIPFHLFINSLKLKESLDKKIKDNSRTALDLKKAIREATSSVEKIKKENAHNEALIQLENKLTEEQKMKDAVKTFGEILQLEEINNIEFNNGNFLITTAPLYTKKESWEVKRCIGTFLIKFPADIKEPHQIKILNTMMRMDIYDHPCIKNTEPCLGNIRSDLESDIERGNIMELILDIIAYIVSPDEQAGYLLRPDHKPDDKMGWEWFLEKAEKKKEGYGFEEWEEEQKEKKKSDYIQIDGVAGSSRATYVSSALDFSSEVTSGLTAYIGETGIAFPAPEPVLFVNSEHFNQRIRYYVERNVSTNVLDIERTSELLQRNIRRSHIIYVTRLHFNRFIEFSGKDENGSLLRGAIAIPLSSTVLTEESTSDSMMDINVSQIDFIEPRFR